MEVRRGALVAVLGMASLAAVPLSTASSYLVRLVTALLAIWLLLRHGNAPGRTSRALLASALAMGILSGLLALGHLAVTGQPSPPGGAADWAYLSYGPLTVAGLLALPRHPVSGPWRLKAATDATLVLASLSFVLVRLFTSMAQASGQSAVAKAAALGYPVNAVFVVAVLLMVVPRLQDELRAFLRWVGVGLTLLMVGDIGYSVASLHGWYRPTTWPAAATQAGLVLVAVSMSFARSEVTLREGEGITPSLFETAAPYLSLVPGMAMVALDIAHDEALTQSEMALVAVLGGLLIVRQLLSSAEDRRTITRVRQREGEARAAALRDPLTGLANRIALHQVLARTLRTGQVTLALLDLDDFKDINDTHGHETGDRVLREIADRLRDAVPEGTLVSRLGGDEFAVCAPCRPAEPLGAALVAAFDTPVAVGPLLFGVTASVGMVLLEPRSVTSAVALSHVDVAMYEAKARREPQRSNVVVLDDQARARAAARVQLREDVSHPRIEQFRLVYQPVVDLASGRVVGAEGLMRWRHPVLGDVPPATFIPLAEQVGSIHELGELALRSAVTDLAGWLVAAAEAGKPLDEAAVLGVNLSPRQLGSPGLVDLVGSLLAEHQVAPERLVLEITEEALLEDWETAVEAVRGLRALGVGVAVDDFGTGYSSMRYLRRFDTTVVKIDREFVEVVADEPRTRTLVAGVIELARPLGLVTIAEGIETLDQLQVLRALGCRLAQGYLFDRPLEREAFGELLLARHTYPMAPLPAFSLQRDEVTPLRRHG